MTFALMEGDDTGWLFDEPGNVIAAATPDAVPAALTRLEAALDAGHWAAGFLSYELGCLMDDAARPLLPAGPHKTPLLWFTTAANPKRVDAGAHLAILGGAYTRGPITPEWDEATYIKACTRILEHIQAGDIYQANLTFRAHFDFAGTPAAFYRDLRTRQPTRWGGMVHTPDFSVLSLSPEMFIETNAGNILTRPMKGTAPRGKTASDDDAQKNQLRTDEKQRAENLMIVDLMRNDLGRIAQTGSVRVERLFDVETHPTLHQMTSDISARLRPGATLSGLLHALFPPGSITGAPKLKAMDIINANETSPRGAYCGAMGVLGPDGFARLNVAIRTITLAGGRGEIGIGSGVVADSDPASEYAECLLKMRFLQ